MAEGVPWQPFVAGTSTGVVVTTTLQPFEVIKTRIIGKEAKGGKVLWRCCNLGKDILRAEGLGGLFCGYQPAILRVAFAAGLNFTCLHFLLPGQGLYSNGRKKTSKIKNMIAGASSRGLSAICVAPLTLLKTLMEANPNEKFLRSMQNVYRTEGLVGFWSGITANLLKNCTYAGLNIMFYISVKEHLIIFDLMSEKRAPTAAGAVSGFLSTLLAHPFEVLRTRIQLNRIHSEKATTKNPILREFVYMYREMKGIHRAEGFQGYTRGIVPKVLKRTISNSITFTLFQYITQLLQSDEKK